MAGLDEVDGWPVFDLILLGIGPDGHLLSVFPGFDRRSIRPTSPWRSPHRPTSRPNIERVTLNPAVIGVARDVLVVVHGPDKAAASPDLRTGQRDPQNAGPGSSRGAPGRPGSSTRRPRRRSPADRGRPAVAPDLVVAADGTLDRRLRERRWAAAHPRPRDDRRPHDVPGGRTAPGFGVPPPCHRSTRPWAPPVTRPAYAIEREFEDVAAVADGRRRRGRAGRCRRPLVWRTVCARSGAADRRRSVGSCRYEGAPTPGGASYHPAGIEARLRERLAAGDRDGALATFMTEVVGMARRTWPPIRANPIWPVRAAAAGTILRELEAETDPAASLERLGGGPPAGPPDPGWREPARLPRGDRGARRAPGATAGSSSSTAPAMPPITRTPTPS